MYHQRLHEANPKEWRFQLQGSRELCDVTKTEDGKVTLHFIALNSSDKHEMIEPGFDLVLLGTGYTRNSHVAILEPIQHLLKESFNTVERDYRLKFKHGAIHQDCGIWLQGCCEASHGVSPSSTPSTIPTPFITWPGSMLIRTLFTPA